MAQDGYAWWYVDALSDDGRHGLTLIAFIGSVFSPYYARARRLGRGDPLHHCALNVLLYGAGGKRWALTERGRDSVSRDSSSLAIGPSALAWDGDTLTVRIEEVTAPLPSRLWGVVRVRPGFLAERRVTLDPAGRHRWWPIAPRSRVEVEMERPDRRWSGPGYLDTNWGDAPLERDFARWHWSRADLEDGGAAVLYEVTPREGDAPPVALRFRPSGEVEDFAPPPPVRLPPTRWRVERATRADAGRPAGVARTLEDTPFYARSVLDTHLLGAPLAAVHESLSLDRFRAGWVQMLLPFRVPRAPR